MRTYLSRVWDCRYFWLSLVANDLHLRYRRSVLGIGWSLLHPLAVAVVNGIVFHQVFKVPIREFLPYILSGLACWAYLTGSIFQGCQSYIQAEPYIRQQSLPLAIYPLRTTLGTLLHFVIALALVLAVSWSLRGPGSLRVVSFVIPGGILFFLFGWAMATVAGFVNVVFRDTQHILEVVFQILFYLTPVIYPASVLTGTYLSWLTAYNPLVAFLNLIREPLLDGKVPSLACFASAGSITVVACVAAAVSLRFQQRRVILHL